MLAANLVKRSLRRSRSYKPLKLFACFDQCRWCTARRAYLQLSAMRKRSRFVVASPVVRVARALGCLRQRRLAASRAAQRRHHLARKKVDRTQHLGERQVAEGELRDEVVGAGLLHLRLD